MPSKNRRLVIAIAVIGLAALAAIAWYANKSAGGVPAASAAKPGGAAGGPPPGGFAMAVEIAKVVSGKLDDEVSAVGSLKSVDSVVLRPEVSGRVAAIRFADGQKAAKGAVLIELDAQTQAAELQQAKANLGLAQANAKRNEDLFQKKFVSQRALEETQAQLKVQEAGVALAAARLDKMALRAPFAGVVGLRSVSVGDYVKEGQELVNFEGVTMLKVDFSLPEMHSAKLAKGQRVELVSDAMPGRRFVATVDAIDPRIDANGRSLAVRARLDNADGALRPGMFVRVRLIFASRENILTIPEQALVPAAQGISVFVVIDGKVKQTPVKPGQRRAGNVEIVEGLKAGDSVVTAGQLKLRDGAPVKPIDEAAPGGVSDADAKPAAAKPAPGR
jgi:membrane fusion protein (multidrug efflux system)